MTSETTATLRSPVELMASDEDVQLPPVQFKILLRETASFRINELRRFIPPVTLGPDDYEEDV